MKNSIIEHYVPFSKEWEKEMRNFTKDELIAKLKAELKVKRVSTLNDAENFVVGTINDFENGLSTKEETIDAMAKFTGRLMEVFWKTAKAQIKENPELLNE